MVKSMAKAEDKKRVKSFISLNKIKLQRGYSYISTFGIPFLVARELGKMSVFSKIGWEWLFIIAMVAVWLIGHIDIKSGFYGNELELSLTKNPEWMKKMKEREIIKDEQ
jgi:hypothetical protein